MAGEQFQFDTTKALREYAPTFPETNEGDSCVKRAFRARTKGFLYLGEKDDSYRILVKLNASIADARALEARQPEHYTVGTTDWVTIGFAAGETPPAGLIERWIDESFSNQAPKAVSALIADRPEA
jgi:hypothetical protein